MITLAHSPADIVRWLMVDLLLGSDPTAWALGNGSDWPVFIDTEPNSPDNVLTVYDTAWQNDGRDMRTGEHFQHYGIQVRIRGIDHPTAFARGVMIRDGLDLNSYNRTVSIAVPNASDAHYTVHGVQGTTLLRLGKQVPSSKRSLFTINGMVTIRAL